MHWLVVFSVAAAAFCAGFFTAAALAAGARAEANQAAAFRARQAERGNCVPTAPAAAPLHPDDEAAFHAEHPFSDGSRVR